MAKGKEKNRKRNPGKNKGNPIFQLSQKVKAEIAFLKVSGSNTGT
jgi:hypothetical protein